MIKLRNAHYCNVKLLLIFFVMYGHLIEPWIDKSNVLHEQYRWIYFFHMPLFCFLSGLFVQTEKDCCIAIRKTLPLYVVLQMLAVLVGQGQVKLLTPYWHFWYLLSYCCWQGLAWLWLKFMSDRSKILILMVVFIAGCFVGYLPFVGRRFSLSRTFVFLPYFFAGVLMKPSFPWKKYRVLGWGALGLATLIVLRVCENIPITFLYQATAFGVVKNGAFYRLICYLIGGLLSFGILTVMPSKRLPFTKAGADTFSLYSDSLSVSYQDYEIAFELKEGEKAVLYRNEDGEAEVDGFINVTYGTATHFVEEPVYQDKFETSVPGKYAVLGYKDGKLIELSKDDIKIDIFEY